jgi:hypothetical protein
MVELEHARELLGSMGLETAATLLDAQMERSLHAEHTYAQFLDELLTSEQQERGRKGEEMRTKLARLPHRKSLEEFDFSFQPSIDKTDRRIGHFSFRCTRREYYPTGTARRRQNSFGGWYLHEGPESRPYGLLHQPGTSH